MLSCQNLNPQINQISTSLHMTSHQQEIKTNKGQGTHLNTRAGSRQNTGAGDSLKHRSRRLINTQEQGTLQNTGCIKMQEQGSHQTTRASYSIKHMSRRVHDHIDIARSSQQTAQSMVDYCISKQFKTRIKATRCKTLRTVTTDDSKNTHI